MTMMLSVDGRHHLGPTLGAMLVDFDGAFVVVAVGVTTMATVDGGAVDFEYLDFLIVVAAVNCCWANCAD